MQKTIVFILFFAAYSAYGQVSKNEKPGQHKPVLNAAQSSPISLEEQVKNLEAKKIRFATQYAPESPEMIKINQLLEQKKALLQEEKRKQNAKTTRH